MTINTKADWAQNRGHDSAAHYSIWHCLMMLSAFEAVKADVDGFDMDSVVEGQNDFYLFMKSLYQDMYANPDQYVIPTAAYDEYMKSEGTDERLSDAHKADAKENRLRLGFQQAIHFYPDYFYQLGLASDGICKDSYALIVEKTKYHKALKALDTSNTHKDNKRRLEVLAAKGIEVKETGDACYITCKQAPKMFLGLKILCDAPGSDFKYMNYLRLNFKGWDGAVPSIDEIKLTMDKKHADVINLFSSLLEVPKMKHSISHFRSITSNGKWKVEYTLNSKRVFEFYAGPSYLVIHIFFKDVDTLKAIIKIMENDDAEFVAWLRSTLIEKLCNCPRNRTIMLGKHAKRICGSTNKVEISDPTKDDVERGMLLIKVIRSL